VKLPARTADEELALLFVRGARKALMRRALVVWRRLILWFVCLF